MKSEIDKLLENRAEPTSEVSIPEQIVRLQERRQKEAAEIINHISKLLTELVSLFETR